MELFKGLIPLFMQLTADELEEIFKKLEQDNIDYFEVAHYEKQDNESKPSSVLVFQGKKVFYDILDSRQQKKLIEHFERLVDGKAKLIKTRAITKKEMERRLEALLSTEQLESLLANFEDDDFESDEDRVGKDETGVLDRSSFYLIAKEPALRWLVEAEEKEQQLHANVPRTEWTLQSINEEPTVFLMPSEIELFPQKEMKELWTRAKVKMLEEFLFSYYIDDSFWPERIDEHVFDEWFEIKQLGLVVDIADSL